MKVVIAGSRTIHHDQVYHAAKLTFAIGRFEKQHGKISMVVSGRATGPDRLGEMWAKANNVHIAEFPALWDLQGRAAGVIRNAEMAEFADAAIILWDGKSNGTKHMIDQMTKLNKPFLLETFEPMTMRSVHHPSGQISRENSTLDHFYV